MASYEQPTFKNCVYMYISLTFSYHHFKISHTLPTVLKVENRSTVSCELYLIMKKLRDLLKKTSEDKLFGMKVKPAMRPNHLPARVVYEFNSEALKVYTRVVI